MRPVGAKIGSGLARGLAVAGCMLLMVLPAACAARGVPPSMVLVVVDTLRPDHLGLYGYDIHPTSPELDARARSAAVFERAFSTAPWTLPAIGSLLTGRLPHRHAAGALIAQPEEPEAGPRREIEAGGRFFARLDETLPTLGTSLQAAGYATAAIVNNAFMSPEFGLARGFDHYDYDPEGPERRAAQATDLALAWLQRHDGSREQRPFFLLVHYFDPHMPYAAPEPLLGRFAAPYADPADQRFGVPVADVPRLRNRIRDRAEGWQRYAALEQALYDEEIAHVDAELERLFAALDARGLLQDGYVVVTADHGEEFYEHDWVEHGHSVFDELIRVPLLVWGPEVAPGRYPLPVSLTDVMPTLLDAAGAPPVRPSDGVSLRQVLREGPTSRQASAVRFDRPLLAEGILYGDEKKALIRWPWKLLVDIEDGYELLFDLEADAAEHRGERPDELDGEPRDRAFSMLAELQRILAAGGGERPGTGATLSEATLERLRALGYIR
jgi:arylsulfatase A-like enzyme